MPHFFLAHGLALVLFLPVVAAGIGRNDYSPYICGDVNGTVIITPEFGTCSLVEKNWLRQLFFPHVEFLFELVKENPTVDPPELPLCFRGELNGTIEFDELHGSSRVFELNGTTYSALTANNWTQILRQQAVPPILLDPFLFDSACAPGPELCDSASFNPALVSRLVLTAKSLLFLNKDSSYTLSHALIGHKRTPFSVGAFNDMLIPFFSEPGEDLAAEQFTLEDGRGLFREAKANLYIGCNEFGEECSVLSEDPPNLTGPGADLTGRLCIRRF